MLRMERVLEVVFEKVTKKDWDNVIIIGGDEGTGKSNLGLHLIDWWYTKLQGKTKPEHIEKVALDLQQFIKGFKDLKRFDCMIYDEAGELSSLRMMNKFNFAVTQAYQVVRGKNLFTIFIAPDIFYFNPFFSTRRARGYIHVYERGRFAYWGKDKLRSIIEINRSRKKKNVLRVSPLFRDTFSIYKGVLAEPYKEKKDQKMSEIQERLYKKLITDAEEEFDVLRYIYNAYKLRGKKLTMDNLGAIFEMSGRNIYRKKDKYIEQQKKLNL